MSTSVLYSSPAALALQRFVDTADLSQLEAKPLAFDTTRRYSRLLCCMGACGAVASACITPLCCPLGVFAPGKYLYPEHALSLGADAINVSTATNDCCCHVARLSKTVPLDKVQDVQLSESWIHTLFGLKAVNIETAGQSGGGANGAAAAPEVSAAFLADPAAARDAIRLAVRLAREHQRGGGGGGGGGGAASTSSSPSMAPAPVAGGMSRAPSAAAAAAADTLAGRLAAMQALVGRGVLSAAEAAALRVAVLAAPHDPTRRLSEAGDLRDRALVTADEFAAIKRALLRQLRQEQQQDDE